MCLCVPCVPCVLCPGTPGVFYCARSVLSTDSAVPVPFVCVFRVPVCARVSRACPVGIPAPPGVFLPVPCTKLGTLAIAMSATVQRRRRALERERARQSSKKSSALLRVSDHGSASIDEQTSQALSALFEARGMGSSTELIRFDAGGTAAAAQVEQAHSSKAPTRSSKVSALEGYLTELKQTDGGDDATLPHFFRLRWMAAIAAARTAESTLAARLGRRPSFVEVNEDDAGAHAMGNLEKLREMRLLILSDGDGRTTASVAGVSSDDTYSLYNEVLMAAGSRAGADDNVGLFTGYSRELLRVRQSLSQAKNSSNSSSKRDLSSLWEALDADGDGKLDLYEIGTGIRQAVVEKRHVFESANGAAVNTGRVSTTAVNTGRVSKARLRAARRMLFGIEQRAQADAAVLAPPVMLPGTSINPEQDESHARYVWLYVCPS